MESSSTRRLEQLCRSFSYQTTSEEVLRAIGDQLEANVDGARPDEAAGLFKEAMFAHQLLLKLKIAGKELKPAPEDRIPRVETFIKERVYGTLLRNAKEVGMSRQAESYAHEAIDMGLLQADYLELLRPLLAKDDSGSSEKTHDYMDDDGNLPGTSMESFWPPADHLHHPPVPHDLRSSESLISQAEAFSGLVRDAKNREGASHVRKDFEDAGGLQSSSGRQSEYSKARGNPGPTPKGSNSNDKPDAKRGEGKGEGKYPSNKSDGETGSGLRSRGGDSASASDDPRTRNKGFGPSLESDHTDTDEQVGSDIGHKRKD